MKSWMSARSSFFPSCILHVAILSVIASPVFADTAQKASPSVAPSVGVSSASVGAGSTVGRSSDGTSDDQDGAFESLTLEALRTFRGDNTSGDSGNQTAILAPELEHTLPSTVPNDDADAAVLPTTCSTALISNSRAAFQAFRINSTTYLSQKTVPTAVNSAGDLVGWYVVPNSNPPQSRAFRAKISSLGAVQNPTTLQNRGLYNTFAFGISDNGQVVVGSGCQDFSGTSGGTNYCSTLTTAITCTGNPPQCFRPRALKWGSQASGQPVLIPKPTTLPYSDSSAPDWCTGSSDTLCKPVAAEAADVNSDGCAIVGNYAYRATDGRPYVQRATRWDAVARCEVVKSTIPADNVLTAQSPATQIATTLLAPVESVPVCSCFVVPGTSTVLNYDFGQPFCSNPMSSATCIDKSSALGISADGATVSGTYIAGQTGLPASSMPFKAFKWLRGVPRMTALQRVNGSRALFPRGVGRRVSPDGQFVVGQDSNGYDLPDAINRPSLIDPGITVYNPQATAHLNQLTEAFIGNYPYGRSVGLGDLVDNEQIFPDPQDYQPCYFESRANDVSSAPLFRVVGNSYAGGITGYDYTEHYRTATVFPSLRGTGRMASLKVDLSGYPVSLNIDSGNHPGWKFDLTNATAISPDGKLIVGTAKCSSGADYSMEEATYGFVVKIKE